MVPSSRSALATELIVHGVVTGFIPGRGFGFIDGDNGQRYFFHFREGRHLVQDGAFLRFQATRENRVPQTSDRVALKATPASQPGKLPQATVWGYETAPRATSPSTPRSLPVVQPVAPATTLEPIEAVIARSTEGALALTMGFLVLRQALSEPALRVFCEFAPKGEALWNDFKKHRKLSRSEEYSWAEYAKSVLHDNMNKLVGPKDCLLDPPDIRSFLWTEALRTGRAEHDAEFFGLYLGDPALVARFSSACKGCSMSTCKFYPRSRGR